MTDNRCPDDYSYSPKVHWGKVAFAFLGGAFLGTAAIVALFLLVGI